MSLIIPLPLKHRMAIFILVERMDLTCDIWGDVTIILPFIVAATLEKVKKRNILPEVTENTGK